MERVKQRYHTTLQCPPACMMSTPPLHQKAQSLGMLPTIVVDCATGVGMPATSGRKGLLAAGSSGSTLVLCTLCNFACASMCTP